jgi:AbrB family looped-hinge helix DNA binding protein
MKTKIDKFGRIVIPKKLREEFGLTPGTQITVDPAEDRIELKPVEDHPRLVRNEDGILVFVGEADIDVNAALRDDRSRRIQKLSPSEEPR